MRFKTWILAFVVFAAICLSTDLVCTRVLIFGNPLSDSARIQHLLEDNSDDIPIFGTSKAHGHYSPDDMGINAFNYGFNGASFDVTDVLLQIELAKPRTTPIVLELQHRDTGILGEQSLYIPFARDSRFRSLLEKYHAMSWRYYVPGIRYFGHYDFILSMFVNAHLNVQRTSRGFSELVHRPKFDRAQMDQYIRERIAYQNGYFPVEDQNRRLIAHITEHPQRIFFLLVSPYHPSYYSNFVNEDKFNEFKKQLATYPNVVLIDWGRREYPDEYWLDTLHLRREAATIYSREVGDKIRQTLQERKMANIKTADSQR
jgi:hypothetical protein